MRSLCLLLALSTVAAADEADSRLVEGRRLVRVGGGEDAEAAYRVSFYLDETDARRAFPSLVARIGSSQKARLLASDNAQTFVLWGHFAKLATLTFTRPVEQGARGVFEAALKSELGRAGPELATQAESFLAMLPVVVKAGDEITLHTDDDGRIKVTVGGDERLGPRSPKLARALWTVWLGARSTQPGLRKALVGEIDRLGAAP
jgi:anti-sigma factor RsiW